MNHGILTFVFNVEQDEEDSPALDLLLKPKRLIAKLRE